MKAGKYNIREFFVNRYLQKIIVPEIQRDYVWGSHQVKGLFRSILSDYKKYLNAQSPVTLEDEPEIAEDFFNFYKRRKYVSNIGFIYAYNDSEFAGKYFLIDGQQRITTIYILLLLLANRNKEIREQFKRTFLFDAVNKLDYKVREAAHEFLFNFTTYLVKGNTNIADQIWLYEEYKNDQTITSILNNTKLLQEELSSVDLNETDFYNYLCDYLEFWYFDTNISEQGEELYIYMNARGEQMQSNENIKADLLSKLESIDEKNDFGKKWENWQDFFWQHREYSDNKGVHKNENADKGFNEFLCCIGGLENLIKNRKCYYSKENFDKTNNIATTDILDSLTPQRIEEYVKALKYLEDSRETFKSQFPNYNKWVDNCISDIWQIFNSEKTNWYADFNDPNRATERNRMIFLWSFLCFITKNIENINELETFRFLRMFYLRYFNFNRSVSTLLKTVDLICINGVLDPINHQMNGTIDADGEIVEVNIDEETDNSSRTAEERIKIHFLNKYIQEPEIQKQFEELIWQIEDHKFNLNGRDVGATNISHLVDLSQDITIDKLIEVRDRFNETFPEDKKNYHLVQSLLLYFGDYWYQVNPYYYLNYEFDNWRRIIRGYTEKNKAPKSCFNEFFQTFCEFDGTLVEFRNHLEEQNRIEDFVNVNTLREQLIWYDQHLQSKMWSKGNNVALREWVTNDGVFINQHKIYNTQGNFKGYRHVELFSLLPEEVKSEIHSFNKNLSYDQ